MNAKEIAMELLTDAGCDLWCYQDDYENALKDINHLIEHDGRRFEVPAEDIAKALVEIAAENPKPKEPMKRFVTLWDNDNACDGFSEDTLEEALNGAMMCLEGWIEAELYDWAFDENGVPHPTEEQIEDWDYMIDVCHAYVIEKDENGDIIDEHYLTDEQYEEIGWMEWKDWKKKFLKN